MEIIIVKPSNLVLVGCGGIGSHLSQFLAKMIMHSKKCKPILKIIDGDKFVISNLERQIIPKYGNKATETALSLMKIYPTLEIEPIPAYIGNVNSRVHNEQVVTPDKVIFDNDMVVLCVDNSATRLIVSQYTQTLKNIILLNGGNDLLDGSVQVYIRQNGVNITSPIEKNHPEIEKPTDRAPYDHGCERLLQEGNTQLLCTNIMVASILLAKIWCLLEQEISIENLAEITYFDLNEVMKEGTFTKSYTYPK